MAVRLRFELKDDVGEESDDSIEEGDAKSDEPASQPIVVEVVEQVTLGRGEDEVLAEQVGDDQSSAEFERQMALLKNPQVDLSSFHAHQRGVSRKHARITLRNMRFTVADLGSTNGTYINNKRLEANQEYTIKAGDELRLGFLTLTFTVI